MRLLPFVSFVRKIPIYLQLFYMRCCRFCPCVVSDFRFFRRRGGGDLLRVVEREGRRALKGLGILRNLGIERLWNREGVFEI